MSPSAITQTTSQVGEETVVELSPSLNELSSLDPLISLLAITYRTKTPSPLKQDRLLTLMHTLAEPSCCKLYAHEEIRNSFIRFLSPVLNGMAGLQDFEKAVSAEMREDPEGFRSFWQLEERNLFQEMVQNGFMGGASPGADVVFLDTFVSEDAKSTSRIALSRDGTLLKVDGSCNVGDKVMVCKDDNPIEGRVVYHAATLGG